MIPGLKNRVVNFNDVMMYLAIGRKHVRLMVLLLTMTLTAGLVFYIYARPVYYARSLVRIQTISRPVDTETVFRDSAYASIQQRLNAPHLVQRVAASLGVHATEEEIYKKYLKRVRPKLNAEQNLELEVHAFSYYLATHWAEALIREFLLAREEQRAKYKEAVVEAYTAEMAAIAAKLDEQIEDKLDLRDEKSLTETMIELKTLRNVPQELVALKKRLSTLDQLRTSVDAPSLDIVGKLALLSAHNKDNQIQVGELIPSASEATATPNSEQAAGQQTGGENSQRPNLVVMPSMIQSAEPWELLDKERRRVQQSIAEASKVYLPGHQKMVALGKELEKIDKALELEYEAARNRLDLEYARLIGKQAELERELANFRKVNERYQKIEKDVNLFETGQLAWRNMYDKMAKQLNIIDYTEDKERLYIQYDGLIEAKTTPVSPNRLRIVIFALGFGLVLMVGVPFLIEYLDHTLTDIEQVESTFRMRGLGVIPLIGAASHDQPVLLNSQSKEHRNLLENFRVIRTNLLSVGSLSKAPHVTMVTSSMPKEGKTVVSSNLALSFAQTGAKTLLIDTDLRRGRLHRIFGLRKEPGLSNYLLEKTSLAEISRPSGHENLTIISAGYHLNNGTELLGSARFVDLMAELRRTYDRIVVDTPPVLGLSETSLLQHLVDGVLFVIWSGRTPIRNMKTSMEILQTNGANFYGFILNRLDLSATTNYYQYYYYSNEYYHNYHALENA